MFFIFIFIFGLAVGSFLNVIICRLETKESIIKGRSHCPKCGAVLKWSDLIPLLSFLIQKGRCRYCRENISWQYPLVELATGLVFLAVFNFQFPIINFQSIVNFQILNLFYYFAITSFLIIIFVYDLKHYLIPDKIVFPAILIALIFNWSNILSAILASGFFLSLVLISKGKWMGLGDVKLAGLMGLVLGWPNILLALFLAFMSGAIIGISLMMAGKKSLKSQIPFGPFLAGSTILVILYGQYLTDWYLININLTD